MICNADLIRREHKEEIEDLKKHFNDTLYEGMYECIYMIAMFRRWSAVVSRQLIYV